MICGDWNIDLLHKNDLVQTLENILVSYDLINIITCPTRVTCSSESLLDVMVGNRLLNMIYIEFVNMGYSDHLAQILRVSVGKGNKQVKKCCKESIEKTMLTNL
jgi:hypothetical protein